MKPKRDERVVENQERYYKERIELIRDRTAWVEPAPIRHTTHPDRIREIHGLEERLPLRRRGFIDVTRPPIESADR